MKWMKIVLPIVVVALGLAAAATLKMTKEEPETRPPTEILPIVQVRAVTLRDLPMTVTSQGTVSPRTESNLVPEVFGRVIEVSPAFVSGGFFEEGDVLLKIDPIDYRQLVIEARARLKQAELRLALEEAEAEIARNEWDEIGEGEPTSLTLRQPQIADAEASVSAARAAVDRAERDLDRTDLRAPYAGRVREKSVDVGEFVSRGVPVAKLYAVDFAEVRLPLPNADLAFIDLPLDYRGERGGTGPAVTLRADYAGKEFEWSGRIVRTEGEIDPMTRMVHAVVRVRDPYGRGSDRDRPPLAAGLFVEAEIRGRTVEDVAVIPRTALREGDRVFVVDDEDRIRVRDVTVLRSTSSRVIVSDGLAEGDRICTSALIAVTDGTRVRTVLDEVS